MRRRVLSGRIGQVLALTLVVLSVGVGLCMFDGHTHDRDGSGLGVDFDLCLGLATVSVAAVGYISMVIHPMSIEPPLAVRVASLHAPDPPPKSPSRF